uniref:Uncharacterized protein n=1 Tax=Rhizophora mucronata TaxID=61149 RepID=A0A2P2PP34_RHIMU
MVGGCSFLLFSPLWCFCMLGLCFCFYLLIAFDECVN